MTDKKPALPADEPDKAATDSRMAAAPRPDAVVGFNVGDPRPRHSRPVRKK